MFKAKISEHDPVNKESLEKLGWKYMKQYVNNYGKEVYEKDNYYMSRDVNTHLICIILRDPSLFIDRAGLANPENFRIVLLIKTMQQFHQLEKMLLWTSESN